MLQKLMRRLINGCSNKVALHARFAQRAQQSVNDAIRWMTDNIAILQTSEIYLRTLLAARAQRSRANRARTTSGSPRARMPPAIAHPPTVRFACAASRRDGAR